MVSCIMHFLRNWIIAHDQKECIFIAISTKEKTKLHYHHKRKQTNKRKSTFTHYCSSLNAVSRIWIYSASIFSVLLPEWKKFFSCAWVIRSALRYCKNVITVRVELNLSFINPVGWTLNFFSASMDVVLFVCLQVEALL